MQSDPTFYAGSASHIFQLGFIPVYAFTILACWYFFAKMQTSLSQAWSLKTGYVANLLVSLQILTFLSLVVATIYYHGRPGIELVQRLHPFWSLKLTILSTATLHLLCQSVLAYVLFSQVLDSNKWFARVMFPMIVGVYGYKVVIFLLYPFFGAPLARVLALSLAGDAMAAVPDIAMVVTIWVGTHRAKGERKARLDRLSSFIMLAWYLRNIQMWSPWVSTLFGYDYYGLLCSAVSFHAYQLLMIFYPLVIWRVFSVLSQEDSGAVEFPQKPKILVGVPKSQSVAR